MRGTDESRPRPMADAAKIVVVGGAKAALPPTSWNVLRASETIKSNIGSRKIVLTVQGAAYRCGDYHCATTKRCTHQKAKPSE